MNHTFSYCELHRIIHLGRRSGIFGPLIPVSMDVIVITCQPGPQGYDNEACCAMEIGAGLAVYYQVMAILGEEGYELKSTTEHSDDCALVRIQTFLKRD